MIAYTINFNSVIEMTDEQVYQLCRTNPEVKFERNATGELIIMPPTGGEPGRSNAELTADFVIWNRQTQLGEVFDSSTCFKLHNGADRSPDVAWVRRDRWETLTLDQKKRFPAIVPDFVLVMSPADTLRDTRTKMQEYLENGVKLAWLINPQNRQVEVYRLGKAVEVLDAPIQLFGEEILPGFVVSLNMV